MQAMWGAIIVMGIYGVVSLVVGAIGQWAVRRERRGGNSAPPPAPPPAGEGGNCTARRYDRGRRVVAWLDERMPDSERRAWRDRDGTA